MRLVVCDDQRILAESLQVALQARGHEVLAATTPEECLEAVAKARPKVCLLDLCLPGREDGLETARAIRLRHRDSHVLILSGVADPLDLSKQLIWVLPGSSARIRPSTRSMRRSCRWLTASSYSRPTWSRTSCDI